MRKLTRFNLFDRITLAFELRRVPGDKDRSKEEEVIIAVVLRSIWILKIPRGTDAIIFLRHLMWLRKREKKKLRMTPSFLNCTKAGLSCIN